MNPTDALSVPCDWLFAARVTLSHVRTPEFITNSGSNSELTDNVDIELCEPADPDQNQGCIPESTVSLLSAKP